MSSMSSGHDPANRETLNELRALNANIKEFNQKAGEQSDKMISLTQTIISLTIVLIGGLILQIHIAQKQTQYAAVQSVGPQIEQAQVRKQALDFCKNNPTASESGLYVVSTGESADCQTVLREIKR